VDRPDLVINLGDVIEDERRDRDLERYRRFVSILGGLKARVLHVAGNHDQVNLRDDDLRALWAHTGALDYSRDIGHGHGIVLRTADEPGQAIHLSEEPREWLRHDLATAPFPTIVLMHHPASEMRLEGNRWFEGRPHRCLVGERRRFRAMVEASGTVVAVFNGHVHWNHLDGIAGLPYVTLQSLTENLETVRLAALPGPGPCATSTGGAWSSACTAKSRSGSSSSCHGADGAAYGHHRGNHHRSLNRAG
jgi:3',5'-cyclic-AMP phosphodiesterase